MHRSSASARRTLGGSPTLPLPARQWRKPCARTVIRTAFSVGLLSRQMRKARRRQSARRSIRARREVGSRAAARRQPAGQLPRPARPSAGAPHPDPRLGDQPSSKRARWPPASGETGTASRARPSPCADRRLGTERRPPGESAEHTPPARGSLADVLALAARVGRRTSSPGRSAGAASSALDPDPIEQGAGRELLALSIGSGSVEGHDVGDPRRGPGPADRHEVPGSRPLRCKTYALGCVDPQAPAPPAACWS